MTHPFCDNCSAYVQLDRPCQHCGYFVSWGPNHFFPIQPFAHNLAMEARVSAEQIAEAMLQNFEVSPFITTH